MVTVTIDLPAGLEKEMMASSRDVAKDVLEAYALALYRQGRLDIFELSRMLGLDRLETSELLQRHRIYRGSLTMEDLEEDERTLNAVMGKVMSE